MSRYDYIIAGSGAAGLSLLMHMISSKKFFDKKILLVDRAPKTDNDRTWCFWQKEADLFEPVVYRTWSKMWFHGADGESKLHDILPYRYKLIRGIDFFEYCFSIIKTQSNVEVLFDTIEEITSSPNETSITVTGKKIHADFIFSSIVHNWPELQSEYFLWQHFRGWVITTERSIFNAEEPVLMDFRVGQQNDTRFVYVMPFSAHSALVEYTVFSEEKLSEQEYDNELRQYCRQKLRLRQDEYTIASTETGMIPMTNYHFPRSSHNIIYIGSAGGQTKASSGYTFNFIQKHSRSIVQAILRTGNPHVKKSGKKFDFYDSVLLNILSRKKMSGAQIFTVLFESGRMKDVMKFLDNETSIQEDIKLISKLPKIEFIDAAVSHLFKIRQLHFAGKKKSSKL